MVSVKGVGAAKFSKNAQVRCKSEQSKKLLCPECAGVPKLAAHKCSEFFIFYKCEIDQSHSAWLFG